MFVSFFLYSRQLQNGDIISVDVSVSVLKQIDEI